MTSRRVPSPSQDRRDRCPAAGLPPEPHDLEDFYREFFLPLVRRSCRRYGLSADDGHDIVQEAFVLAIVKLDTSKNPRAWLYQVVDHLSANFQRKSARRARLTAMWNPARPEKEQALESGRDEQ